MKKRIFLLIVVAFMIYLSGIQSNLAYANDLVFENVDYEKSDNIRVISDNGQVEFDVNPQIIDSRTLVPMRAIFEELGLEVDWDNESRTAKGKNNDTEVSFTIDSDIAVVNNKLIKIDVSASIIDDRTMIPLRFLSENMGYNIEWVENSNLILMSKEDIVVDWELVKYELEEPFKEYEIKSINGTETLDVRYTGKFKPIEIVEEEVAEEEIVEEEIVEEEIVDEEIVEEDPKDDGITKIYLSPSNQPANLYAVGDTTEKIEMEDVATRIYEILSKEYDCEVIMATESFNIWLEGRPLEAKEKNCDIYLAIHSNAGTTKNATGAVGFYHPLNIMGKILATNIIEELNNVNPIKSNRHEQVSSGMKPFNGYGLAEVRDPSSYGLIAVLVETEFHDNPITASWIINNKDTIANAYVDGIVKTFALNKK